MSAAEVNQIINGLAEFFAKSMRTPILRRPDEFGMRYEDVFFPSIDGVGLEGWFTRPIPTALSFATTSCLASAADIRVRTADNTPDLKNRF